jgi:hypothetical protein
METPPTIYEIQVAGHLSLQWADWFEGLTITLEEDGNTRLTGPVADQAALHGLLKKVRDLGMPLVSVIQVQFHETHQDHSRNGVIKMNSIKKTSEKIDTKVLLSTLWIVVMINMAYADILGLFIPGTLEEVAKTSVSTGTTIPQLMLGGAIMLEIPIVMILLSRVLKFKANRWANIIASVITIVYVVGAGALSPHYIFIATIEVVCMLLIVWFAWKWRNPEGYRGRHARCQIAKPINMI